MKLNLALLQLLPGATLAEQRRIGAEACREAKKLGADLALFPEMWSCGYVIPEDPDALQALAVSQDSEFVQSFGRLARELDMAVGITYLERYHPAPRNTMTLFDRHGNAVLTYAKVHTCDFGDEARLTPGDAFRTASLDTAKGPVQVGAMICYDREFPESARILMLQGAELILTPNACPMEINRLCQLRARAFENMLAIATVNYPAGQPDCNGHSTVFDGVPWLPDAPEVRDMLILDAGEAPGIYLAELDLDLLRSHREEEVHGNAFRRPDRYGALTVDDVRPPFVRKENRWRQGLRWKRQSRNDLRLYIPKPADGWFYVKLLSDPATMAYNAPWFPPDGCIPNAEAEWEELCKGWIGQEPKRFYAYLQRKSDGAFVGDVNFHYNPDKAWWDMGIVIYAPERGKGYGKQGLRLLIDRAFRVAGVTRLHNEFETTRDAACQIHKAVGFREVGTENGIVQLELTKEDYLK